MIELEKFSRFFLSLSFYIEFAIVESLFALIGIFCMYLSIIYMRLSSREKNEKKRSIVHELSRLTSNLIISQNKAERIYSNETLYLAVSKLKMMSNGKLHNRSEIVEHLIGLRRLFEGETAILLKEVYISLGLHRYALKGLENGNAQVKISAIRELQHMGVRVHFEFVKPLLKYKNHLVRRIARCYCLKFYITFPFDSLYRECEDLQHWEQFELFSIITERDDNHIPLFSHFLEEKQHPSIISFCLKMVVYFKQTDAIPAMKRLLSSDNISIVKETIFALGELRVTNIEDFFIANYKYQPEGYKIEILKAIGKIKSNKYLYFLRQEFGETEFIDVKKQILKSLISKNPESANLLWNFQSDDGINRTVLQHVLNPLIKN